MGRGRCWSDAEPRARAPWGKDGEKSGASSGRSTHRRVTVVPAPRERQAGSPTGGQEVRPGGARRPAVA